MPQKSDATSTAPSIPTTTSSQSPSMTAATSCSDDAQPTAYTTAAAHPSSTASSGPSRLSSKSVPIAAIAGGVGGVVALIAIGLFLLVCIKRRNRKNVYQAPIYVSPYNTDSDTSPTFNSVEKREMRRSYNEAPQLDGREVEIGRRLGNPSLRWRSELPAEPVIQSR